MILEIQRNGMQLHVFNTKEDDVVLGRGKEADCPINAEDISRLHCRIKFKDGKYYIQDLKSSNGTFVYDEKIPPGDFHEFLPDFPVKIGKSVLVFVHNSEPLQDIGGYDKTNPNLKVSQTEKTQTFTGVIKKEALKPKKEEKKSMNLGLLLVPLLLAGGAAYYYLIMRAPAPGPVAPVVAEAPKVVEPTDPNLQGVPKQGCFYDDEKILCQGLELAQDDFASIQVPEVTVVINWQRTMENKMAEMGTLPEDKRELFVVVNMLLKARTLIAGMTQLEEVKMVTLVGTSADYKRALRKSVLGLENLPTEAEIAPVIQAAISSGNTQDFDTKYGSLFSIQSF